MKRFMMSLTAISLGLAISGTALADNKGHGNKQSNHGNVSTKSIQIQSGNQNLGGSQVLQKKGGGVQQVGGVQQTLKSNVANNTKNKVVQQNQTKGQKKFHDFKEFHGFCYKGNNFKFWTHCYFDAHYGCDLYFCPVRT